MQLGQFGRAILATVPTAPAPASDNVFATILGPTEAPPLWAVRLLRQERKIHTKQREAIGRFLEAVFWVNRSGAQWRFLPAKYREGKRGIGTRTGRLRHRTRVR